MTTDRQTHLDNGHAVRADVDLPARLWLLAIPSLKRRLVVSAQSMRGHQARSVVRDSVCWLASSSWCIGCMGWSLWGVAAVDPTTPCAWLPLTHVHHHSKQHTSHAHVHMRLPSTSLALWPPERAVCGSARWACIGVRAVCGCTRIRVCIARLSLHGRSPAGCPHPPSLSPLT
jgi:hypothetical protein